MVKKVLFITSNQGIEHDELTEPLNFLKSKGFEVIHAAEKNEDVATVKGDTKAATQYTPDTSLEFCRQSQTDCRDLSWAMDFD